MATKPATTPRVWDTTGVYATGPFIGSVSIADPGAGIAAEGHRPGASFPTAAEHENYQQNAVTAYVTNWLALGSSAGAADAHIMETDAVGRFGAVGATFVDAVDETCIDITAANTLAPAVLVTSAATCYQSDVGATGTGFSAPIGAASSGTGFSSTMTAAGATATGVSVSANATTAGTCIAVTHAGSGLAVSITATGTATALEVTGSSSSARGATFTGGTTSSILATGVGAALGGDFVSGATAGAGALRATTANNTGTAIQGAVPITATSAARAFYASVGGAAVAAELVAAANHALILTGDTTAPTYGALKISECNAVPSSPLDEQIAIVRQTVGVAPQVMHSCLVDFPTTSGWRGMLSTTGGSALGQAYTAGPTTASWVGAWYSVLSVTASAGNAPKLAGGQILLRITFSWRVTPIASDATLGVRIIDFTADPGAASPVFQRAGIGSGASSGYLMPTITTSNWSVPMTIFCPVTVPLAGSRTWRLDIQTAGPGQVTVRDISLDFLGML